MSLKTYDCKLTLISLYGPNNDNPSFYQKLQDLVSAFDNTHCIIVGDWNWSLNQNLDTSNYLHENNPRSKKVVLEFLNNENLVDVWRVLHPTEKSFTWRQPNPFKQSRLDFFILSSGLFNKVVSSSIYHGYRSDHSLIQCIIKLNKIASGRGFWKFNNSLLKDDGYINVIFNVIDETIAEYACSPYDKTNIKTMNGYEVCLLIDDQLFFETLICNIRGKSISYSSYKKRVTSEREKFLIEEIDWMEKNTLANSWRLNYVDDLKKELQEIRLNKVNDILLRSRAQRIDEDEKPSKYFLNLQKRNYEEKLISFLKIDKDEVLYANDGIKAEVYNFYKNLYRNNDGNVIDLNLEQGIINKLKILSDSESQDLEDHLVILKCTML